MSKRILVVDDDELILLSLTDLFARGGLVVQTADSGKEALALVQTERFDLVVLDIIMPGMSGIEVCRALRATPGYEHTPIIMLTAKSTPAEEAKGLEAGASYFLPKPFDPARLQQLAAEQLGP